MLTETAARPLVRSRRSIVAPVLVGVGAALLSGIAAGLVARGLMRLAALAVGADTAFSVEGTAMILLVFGVLMIPGAVARAFAARRTAVVLLALGAVAVAFGAVSTAVQDLSERTLTTSGAAWVAVIGVGFAVAIAGLAVLAWRIAARWTS